jgi:hypothetical protein
MSRNPFPIWNRLHLRHDDFGRFAPEARNGFVRWRIVSSPRQDQGLIHLVLVDFARRSPPFISDL